MSEPQWGDAVALRAQAEMLKTAGDIVRDDSNPQKALLFYDAAIDQYLRAGDTAMAQQLCEVVVSLAPNGMRARCTLAWLAVLLAPADVSARRIAQYAEAAVHAGVSDIACRQLRCMAEEVDAPAVLEVIADALHHLGDVDAAARVYSRIYDRNVPARVYENAEDHARVVAARLTMALTL